MISKNDILTLAEPLVLQAGLFVVDITTSTDNDIQITIDAERRLNLDDCITISKQIEGLLDREKEDFSLTVISAGIGAQLTDHRQFAKITGGPVEVILQSGQKIIATLTAANVNPSMQGNITIQYSTKETVEGKKRKETIQKNETIEMEQIKSVSEQLDIK